jgi:hypothetical protein
MRLPAAFVLMLTLAARTAVSAEVIPVMRDHHLGIAIRATALPTTFPNDLVSGLTNKLLIRVGLFSGGRQVDRKTVEISIKYDLWDETFNLTISVDEAAVASRTNLAREAVEAFLADIRIPDLFAAGEMREDGVAAIRVEMLLNPVERERIEAIQKWVAENSTYTPADTPGFSDKRVGNSRSNAIFNRIFEQYANGADTAATWKQSLSSKPFKIEEVGDER